LLAQHLARRNGQLGSEQRQRCRCSGMAARAVGVVGTIASAIIASNRGIAAALMNVLMVPRMLAGRACCFMRAKRRSCRPCELNGQDQQHEDDEPATHGRGL
jgi:hypothetical protein